MSLQDISAQYLQVVDASTDKNLKYFTVKIYKKTGENLQIVAIDSCLLQRLSNIDSIKISQEYYHSKILSNNQIQAQNFIIKLSPKVYFIEETVISDTKWEEKESTTDKKITKIDKKAIEFQQVTNTADALKLSGNVFVQKSQFGGGSPMIRGFAANRVLLVIDGVRINNPIYRSGNLQNAMMLDAFSIENIEVIHGPGSVVYGSDALGGVFNFQTNKLSFNTEENKKILSKINAGIEYKSASSTKVGHFDYQLSGKKIAYLGSLSYQFNDDLLAGSNGLRDYLRYNYIDQVDGKDTILTNSNPQKQLFSGYSQFNLIQKIGIKTGKYSSLSYNFHLSQSSDIPRYDRLIQTKNGELNYAEWYYGPQKWQMHQLKFEAVPLKKLYDKFQASLAYQNYEESRHDRKFQSNSLRSRTEKVEIFSLNADFSKYINEKNEIYYGIESIFNGIKSFGIEKNIKNNETTAISSRYPAENIYLSNAIYANSKHRLANKVIMKLGLRFSIFSDRSMLDTMLFSLPYDKIEYNTQSFSSNIGLVWNAFEKTQFNFSLSNGFRAPNIDDFGKIFDSEPGQVILPNPNLKPEYLYNSEFTIKQKIGKSSIVSLTGFYSYLKNAIVRDNFTLNGQDSIIYDGTLSQISALQNLDYANIFGIELNIFLQLMKWLSIKSNWTLIKGEGNDGSAIRHAPPLFSSHQLIFSKSNVTLSFGMEHNSMISNKNLANSERYKTDLYAKDANGDLFVPEFFVFDFHGLYKIKKHVSLKFGVENIFDKLYRPYSSGISAPGRSFNFGTNIAF